MIKKVNKNKFGVIEYSITDEQDLKDLPKGDSDNSVYAVDDNNKVYLYSKKANNYILINGGGTNPDEFTIKKIDMGNTETEVDIDLINKEGYYSVIGAINEYELNDSIVHVAKANEQDFFITLYEHCKHVYGAKDEGGRMVYNGEIQFESMLFIGDLSELPSRFQGKTLVEIISMLDNLSPQ